MTIGTNIKKFRKKLHMTQSDLAEVVGVKISAVSAWEIGRSKPLMDKVELLAKFFNVSKSELIGEETNPSYQNNYIIKESKIPIYGVIPAGVPSFAEENIIGDMYIPEAIANKYGISNLFSLKVNGDSMNKIIMDEHLAVLQRTCSVINGDVVAVLINGYDATLKKVHKTDTVLVLEPCSFNEKHEAMIFKDNNPVKIEILGKLVWQCAPVNI